MTSDEQIAIFEEALDKLIDRYTDEFDLPVVSLVGVLHMKIYEITTSAYKTDNED